MKCTALVWTMLAGSGWVAAAPVLQVIPSAGAPGTTAPVAVSYTTDTNAPSLQFDLVYATNYLGTGTPTGGNALSDHQVGSSEVAPGIRRVLIFSFSNAPLTNGVLVYVPFLIAPDAPDHDELLTLSNVLVVNAEAEVVPSYSSNGVLAVAVPPLLTIAASTDGAIHLQVAGTSDRAYRLEGGTNLASPGWTPLATNTATNGVATFDDAATVGAPSRFYRAALAR